MSPDDPRHGTSAGYVAGCRETCCRTAIADWTRHYRTRQYLHGHLIIDGLGTRRRIRALMALGWSTPLLDQHLGRRRSYTAAVLGATGPIRRSTAEMYARLYDQLAMQQPPLSTRYERQRATRTRNYAARQGWPPPLAWDDIDNPDEHPTGWEYRPSERGELLVELDRFNAGISEVCQTLKVSRDALEKWCERHGYMPVYSRILSREITNPASPFSGNKHRKVS